MFDEEQDRFEFVDKDDEGDVRTPRKQSPEVSSSRKKIWFKIGTRTRTLKFWTPWSEPTRCSRHIFSRDRNSMSAMRLEQVTAFATLAGHRKR